MPTINTIDDVSNIRSIGAAVTANAGAIAIQNVNGTLKQVDDQGTVSDLGGGGGTVTSVVAGQNVAVDSSTPAAPVVSTGAKRGTALTDADQTLQPGTDKASEYAQTTALTANRVKTLGVTSAVTGQLCRIVRRDTAAFTLAVANGGTNGGTLLTFGASPTGVQAATSYYNGVDWVLVGFEYLAQTA